MMKHCANGFCSAVGVIPIRYSPEEIWSCDRHYVEIYKSTLKGRTRNANLGLSVDTYQKKDGSMGKISTGKAWEISNRVISKDDNKTVINRVTGKEAQY